MRQRTAPRQPSSWRDRGDVSDYVWCLEAEVNASEHEANFPDVPTPTDARDNADRPSGLERQRHPQDVGDERRNMSKRMTLLLVLALQACSAFGIDDDESSRLRVHLRGGDGEELRDGERAGAARAEGCLGVRWLLAGPRLVEQSRQARRAGAEAGAGLALVEAEVCGWKDAQTVLRCYQQADEVQLRKAPRQPPQSPRLGQSAGIKQREPRHTLP